MNTKPIPEGSGKRIKDSMNFSQDKIAGYGDKSSAAPWLTYMLIGFVGLVITGILGYGIYISYRMNTMYAPLVDAAKEIKFEATTAHLRFEEIIGGDRYGDIGTVWKHLNRADGYANAMLEGSEKPEMRREIREVQEKLSEFRNITQKRLEAKEISGPSTDIDQRTDAIFSDFIYKADNIESRLRQLITQYLRRFNFTYTVLIIVYVLLTVVIATAFHRFDRRRANDVLTLGNMNQVLQKEITQRRQAEEIVRSERDKLQGVLSAIGEGLYIVDHDFNIEFQNEVLSNRFGDNLDQKCYSTFFQSNEPCGFCIMRHVIASNKIKSVEVSSTDGRHFDIIFSPFKDVDEHIKAIVLSRDITEKKTLQAEAMRAGHLASVGELAAGVAHEINNPINGIISYAEILKDQFAEQHQDAEIPTRIIKEGERIAQIVMNLLSFARERDEEPIPSHVKEILSDALELVKHQIKKDGIKLSLDVPSGLPKIKARSHEIQQVFLNILSNARYALNQRFPEFNVDKFLEIRAETIEIEGRKHVRTIFYDSGKGISTNILDKICNPFFSTKPAGEGTGLGLSISHGIVKSHGGRLWFQSIEGKSTMVMIDLPTNN
jgi:signal transduction histidine kinase